MDIHILTEREIQEGEQEYDVQEALYGPQTRSGQVGEVEPVTRYKSANEMLVDTGVFWMDWDSIVWFPVGHSVVA